ncbi:MAG: AAA domain-containing protein [Crenarchaeota archaeon]|nr:AAA domain-containing protein [Thermoproteota archaeon]
MRDVVRALVRFFGWEHEERIRVYVAAQLAGLPTLLAGSHGSGKTTLVKAFYSCIRIRDGDDYRPVKTFMMLLKERHTPTDVFYRYHIPSLLQGREVVIAKAIAAEAVFLDEVFANELILAALKDFLEEKIYDRFECKWMFFTAATNPPNQFYQNILMLRNLADLDRFDIVIEWTHRTGIYLTELVENTARSKERRTLPDLPEIHVDDIERLRREILSTRVGEDFLKRLWLLATCLSTCVYSPVHERDTYTIVDKFSIYSRLPCETCKYQHYWACKYALAPTRFIRSCIALGKALAWLDDREVVDSRYFMTAARYSLPLRLVPTRQDVEQRYPTLTSLVNNVLSEFMQYYTTSWSQYRDYLMKLLEKYVKEGDITGTTLPVEDPITALVDSQVKANLRNIIIEMIEKASNEELEELRKIACEKVRKLIDRELERRKKRD